MPDAVMRRHLRPGRDRRRGWRLRGRGLRRRVRGAHVGIGGFLDYQYDTVDVTVSTKTVRALDPERRAAHRPRGRLRRHHDPASTTSSPTATNLHSTKANADTSAADSPGLPERRQERHGQRHGERTSRAGARFGTATGRRRVGRGSLGLGRRPVGRRYDRRHRLPVQRPRLAADRHEPGRQVQDRRPVRAGRGPRLLDRCRRREHRPLHAPGEPRRRRPTPRSRTPAPRRSRTP